MEGIHLSFDNNNRMVVLDALHHWVHKGYVYEITTENLDMDTNEIDNILIKTGTQPMHFFFEATAFGGRVEIYMFEDTVVSANGTEVTPFAFNREYSIATDAKFYTGPTITSDGTAFPKREILAFAQGSGAVNASVRAGAEILLAKNKNYLLRFKSTADNVIMSNSMLFYSKPII